MPAKFWSTLKDIRLLIRDRNSKRILYKKVEEYNPDLIYERANYLQLSGVNVARKFGVTHILEMNSPYIEEKTSLGRGPSWLNPYACYIEKQQILGTTKVAVISSALRNYFMDKYGIESNKFTITSNAINPEKINFVKEEVDMIKQKYGLENYLIVGFVGSLYPWHGVDLLIRTSKVLADSGLKFKVLIVGDGSRANELKQIRDKLKLQNIIIFTGRVPHKDIFNFIEAMDITVYPGSQNFENWYGSPVKLFEYGAMGKPVIIYDQVPIRDVMTPNKDGILIKPTVEELSSAINLLSNNSKLRHQLAYNFKNKVHSKHTWDKNVKKLLNLGSPE